MHDISSVLKASPIQCGSLGLSLGRCCRGTAECLPEHSRSSVFAVLAGGVSQISSPSLSTEYENAFGKIGEQTFIFKRWICYEVQLQGFLNPFPSDCHWNEHGSMFWGLWLHQT